MLPKVLLLLFFVASVRSATECLHRDFGYTGTVCVCNAEHCDTIDPITEVPSNQYISYTSNLEGLRFQREVGEFSSTENSKADVIDRSKRYQEIVGFGGAFTDATGINLDILDEQTREHLIRSYFSDEGIEYSLCRVPIGGTDFSTRSYSYLDTRNPDLELANFALQDEDYNYKIPYILQALELTENKLQFFASAWTAPAWMKTNEAPDGDGELKREYWQLWVDYFIKFFDSYKAEGIEFWGLTTGNEPSLAFFTWTGINSIGWLPWTQNKWIARNLGPTIRNSEYSDLKLMTHDDQRILLPLMFSLLADEAAASYLDGIAVHWYWNDFVPASWQTNIHELYPEKFFINTEACKGDRPWDSAVRLGSWDRGEQYARDIIENLQHWSVGWVDWNMALNTTGGPSYISNEVDAPIIVNPDTYEFYKQPMFYAIGHYSKFITKGSVRIGLPFKQNGVSIVAFDRPDEATVIVAINTGESETEIHIQDPDKGLISKVITAKSFNTIIYW
ncbi:glucosylceramidase [Holotrichia oblita]|uniref:Glucosylceramidase n=1 Tax=Holotrichia oblita TaxID=644536 RepID=A0ACB9TL19_HOLOL|nr:glucosylceramidase [Holotrichia oblita]